MNDRSGGRFGAAFETEIETALGQAAANTVMELPPEAAEILRRRVRREVRRLELAGSGAVEAAAMRLWDLFGVRQALERVRPPGSGGVYPRAGGAGPGGRPEGKLRVCGSAARDAL